MSEKEIEEKKKRDSKKFIKIYMATLVAVVLILISMSYFAQDKLNSQIENLTNLVDSTEKEAISHFNKVEKLQELTKEQEKLLKQQEQKLTQLDNITLMTEGLDKFWRLQKLYLQDEYEKCVPFVIDIEVNFTLPDDAQKEFDIIKNDLLEKELVTKNQIDQAKAKVQN